MQHIVRVPIYSRVLTHMILYTLYIYYAQRGLFFPCAICTYGVPQSATYLWRKFIIPAFATVHMEMYACMTLDDTIISILIK